MSIVDWMTSDQHKRPSPPPNERRTEQLGFESATEDDSFRDLHPSKIRVLKSAQDAGDPIKVLRNQPKYPIPSHEEWISERVRSALVMLRETIEVNPRKRGGIPVLKGTRFTLAQVLAELAAERNVAELAEDFDLDLDQLKTFLEGLSICLDRPAFQSQ